MRTLLYIFSVRNAIKRKKDLFSLKRSATCAMAKNNLLKSFATSARAEVVQLALCASNCGMPTSARKYVRLDKRTGKMQLEMNAQLFSMNREVKKKQEAWLQKKIMCFYQ